MPPLNGPQPEEKIVPINGTSLIRGNQVTSAIASMISGVTRIRNTVAIKAFVQPPGRRANATPDIPPIITAIIVAPNAAMNEFRIASPMPAKSKIVLYQLVIKPLTTKAKTNAAVAIQVLTELAMYVLFLKYVFATSPIAIKTANRIKTAKDSAPSNNSPHHLRLVLPDQIVNELPALNECKITSKIGTNRNIKTSTVQMASNLLKTSRLTRV